VALRLEQDVCEEKGGQLLLYLQATSLNERGEYLGGRLLETWEKEIPGKTSEGLGLWDARHFRRVESIRKMPEGKQKQIPNARGGKAILMKITF